MAIDRSKLYTLLFIACIVGYVWLLYGVTSGITISESIEVCLIKRITNVPCPSCGSTRSVVSILRGDFKGALYLNPLGFIIALVLVLAPVWIVIDLILKSNTLFAFYIEVERKLRKPRYAIPLIALVVGNWIWNIIKGL